MRFKLRTLLGLIAAVAILAGLISSAYHARVVEFRRDMQVLAKLESAGITGSSTYVGPGGLERHLHQVRRVTRLWCEEATDLNQVAARLRELDRLEVLQVLARQIVPRADSAAEGKPDPLLRALNNHPSLRQIIVDASIRGAPLEFDAPLYTRKDLAKLEAALPKLEIIWIEVN